MNKIRIFISILFTIFLIVGCNIDNKKTNKKSITNEDLININKKLLEDDSHTIEKLLDSIGLKMLRTQSGLWYIIEKAGNGNKVELSGLVTFNYNVSLLDSTFCYSSDISGPKSFYVGKGGVESGLEEGVLLLREGDKAKFIMLPHLAYGLVGDNNKIPARATIIYDVEILSYIK